MTTPDRCVFCDIVDGRSPATVVREWDDCIAIVPLNPVVDGHVLVLPKLHVRDALVSPSIATAQAMARAAEIATHPCNIITSVGEEATQTVFHLHVHVVPRAAGDGLPLPWTPQQEGYVLYENTPDGWTTTFHDPVERAGLTNNEGGPNGRQIGT